MSLKVSYKKGTNKKSPMALVKCNCGCGCAIEIYYDDDGLEIGGVQGDIDDWRRILFPLLMVKKGEKIDE